MIHALYIASNYLDTANELPDCTADACNWQKLLKPWCGSSSSVLNTKATRAGILRAGRKWLDKLRPGDLGVLLFSGHGTRERMDGRYVEAIVCDDLELIYDFEMAGLLGERAKKTTLVVLSDSCHSGTMHRGNPIARTIPLSRCRRHHAKGDGSPRALTNVIYFAGCAEDEYSYSTGQGGAMSLAMQKAFAERGEKTTFGWLYRRVAGKRPKGLLPTDEWPQTPQVHASAANLRRTLRSFVV